MSKLDRALFLATAWTILLWPLVISMGVGLTQDEPDGWRLGPLVLGLAVLGLGGAAGAALARRRWQACARAVWLLALVLPLYVRWWEGTRLPRAVAYSLNYAPGDPEPVTQHGPEWRDYIEARKEYARARLRLAHAERSATASRPVPWWRPTIAWLLLPGLPLLALWRTWRLRDEVGTPAPLERKRQ